MTTAEFKKIARLLKQIYQELELEAIREGISTLSPEYDQLVAKAREKVLENQGFTLQEYREAKGKVSGFSQADYVDSVEQHSSKLNELDNRHIPTIEEIAEIAEEVAQKYIVPPQITNQIVKEYTVEKPRIIETTKQTIIKEKYNPKPLEEKLSKLEVKVDNIKIPKIDLEGFREELTNQFQHQLENNINVLDMPNFRKLAMGLRADIDRIDNESSSGGGTWGSITGTLSDQTDLQSALDAKQATLVSGTNIKTINSTSLLGSGDIAISASPGGSDTQVQFNDGGVFGGDSAFTWNKTNNVMTLTVSSDNPPIQIITGGSNLVDVGAIKLWSAADNSTEKLLSAGDGVTFDENVAIYASGYIDVVPEGTVAYDAHVLKKNTVGFNAGRAGTAELSGSVTGLFSSAQSVSDGRIFGFWANMGTQDGGGMLIQGTGGAGTSEIGKHLVIWGNTAANANKAISIGNGTTFTEKAYILNNGNAYFSGEVTLANTGLHLLDSNASHDLIIKPGSDLTTDRTLTLTTGDADVILNLSAVTDEYVLAYDTGTNTWRGVASSGGASFGTDNQIPFTNAGGTDFDYSANLTFTGDQLIVETDTAGTVPLIVRSSTSTQTANLLEVRRYDAASGLTVAYNTEVTLGGIYDYVNAKHAPGHNVVYANSGYTGGLKLQNLSSGSIVRLHTLNNGLYLTDNTGTAASMTLGTRTNPADASTFIASSGRWIISAGGFVVNNATWTGNHQTELFSTTLPQLGLLYDSSNYLSATINSTGSATFNLTGTSPEFTFSDAVNVPDEAYGSGWNGSTEVPTKNAVYDKIETLAGGSTPRLVKTFPFDSTPSTDTQASNYYTVTGSGAVTTSSGGYQLDTGTTDGSQIRMRFRQNWLGDGWLGWDHNPEFIFMQGVSSATSGSGIIQYTIGDNGGESTSAGALVSKHMGFLFCWSSGTLTVYASNGNGSTQTTTDVTASYTGGQTGVFRCTMTSATNIKFYIDGVLVATHTTNLPSGALSNTATLWSDLDTGTTSRLTSTITHWQFSGDC